jgi:uncharacterized protein involved in tolerance to divalent cations
MKNKYSQLYLTCANKAEADKISDALLVKHLIVCAKQVPVNSKFHGHGKIESRDEILLIMDSREDLFKQAETEVAKLHSYETFVLQQASLEKVSEKADHWLRQELA